MLMPGFNIKKELAVILGYTAIAIITTYPLILNLSSLLGPAEDNLMFVWNLWWFKYSIFDLGTSPFYTHYLFFPEGAGLLFHTFSPLNNVFGLVLTAIFGFILSYNILILLSFIIAAYGGYLLARELGLRLEASFIAGLIFSFNPFHFAQAAHHLNISSIQFIPFLLYFAIKACRTGKLKYIFIGSILLAANFYLGYYIFLFSLFILIPLLFFRPGRKSKTNHFQQIKPVLYILILGSILTLPLSVPIIKESFLTGFTETTGYDIFVADLAGFIFPHKYHWTEFIELSNTINSSYTGNFWESTSFLGYAVLAMAIWTVVKKRFALKRYFIAIGLLGIILALGTYPHFLGKEFTLLPLPYNIIKYIPGLNAARSPGRFVILTYLSLGILAAAAVDSWIKSITQNKARFNARLLFIGLSLLVILDYWSAPFQISKIEIPDFYQTMRSQSGDFAILDIPPASRDANLRYMYYQTIHQKPICGGQLARSQKSIENYFKRWRGVEINVESLRERKIKYVILHGNFLPADAYSSYFKRLESTFKFIEDENGLALFQVY